MIVPCGASKVWDKKPSLGPVKAMDAYIGAPFKVHREYAEKYADHWLILSAKYGLIESDAEIPGNYNVTFKDPATNPIGIEQLMKQAEMYRDFDKVVAFGGKDYTGKVERIFKNSKAIIVKPEEGLPLGLALGKVKEATLSGVPF